MLATIGRDAHRLQLVPQSALPEVQGAARALWLLTGRPICCRFPISTRVHAAPADRGYRLPEQDRRLCDAVQDASRPDHAGRQSRRLGARSAASLCTLGADLTHHPHVHCVVPAADFSTARDGSLPRELLSRRQPLARSSAPVPRTPAAPSTRRASLSSAISRIGRPRCLRRQLAARVARLDRHAKKPFGGPAQFSPISAATPIASPSPTAASSLRRRPSPSPGRIIATRRRQDHV